MIRGVINGSIPDRLRLTVPIVNPRRIVAISFAQAAPV
jgi:hypothetical protein